MSKHPYTLVIIIIGLLASSCEESNLVRPQNSPDASIHSDEDMALDINPTLNEDLDQDVDVSCSSNRRPIVFVHGFLAAGDTWNRQIIRLTSTGSCPHLTRVYDWNSLDMSGEHTLTLNDLIDDLINQSDYDQVDLVGHSAGGGIGYSYLEQATYMEKVHKYVHIGSFSNDQPAGVNGEIPTLNLWSIDDLVVEGADIPNAENRMIPGLDHYSIATSFESYQYITKFLYGDEPLTQDPFLELENSIQLNGRILTLGENTAQVNTPLTVWALGENGQRLDQIMSVNTDEDGRFVLNNLETNQAYELLPSLEDESAPKVKYFTPQLNHSHPEFYLRTFPGEGSIASLLVRQLPSDSEQVALVIFNAHRAFLAGADSLQIDGQELLTESVASADNTAIALFVFDINNDDDTGSTIPLFDGFPFLSVVDFPITPSTDQTLTLNYNGQILNLPKSPSNEGIMVVVFP